MRCWWFASLLAVGLTLTACDSSDGSVEGARAECAFGGELTDCPDAERTPEGACWRLVECGALTLEHDEEGRFDWGECVNYVESLTDDRQRAMVSCIAATTCDELRASDHCGEFGR